MYDEQKVLLLTGFQWGEMGEGHGKNGVTSSSPTWGQHLFGALAAQLVVGKREYRVVSLLAPHLSAPALPQPLPEMEYNGNPESVGYKIKYSRSDGHGKTLSHVVQDRVEREYTIEDLEEWTEYRVQVQAFNAIGSGPWSQAVMGRTRESGTTALLGPPKSSHF